MQSSPENLIASKTNNGNKTNGSSNNNNIFNVGSNSIYNYSSNLTSTPGPAGNSSKYPLQQQQQQANAISSSNTNNTNTFSSSTGANSNSNSYVEIQAQFELSIELRKFINIDLFQRGYYQIRFSIKCGNKQIPIKIIVQLENTQSNNNLSGNLKHLFSPL